MRRLKRAGAMAVLIGLLAASFAVFPGTARADREHDPLRAGHPLRVAAYLLHPVGYFLDLLIFRPAHWFVSRDAMAPIFGHTEDS
jgi:hypothetical protein